MIGVYTGIFEYRVAVAELPRSARLASSSRGAIVVVPGDRRWANRVGDAFDAGAVAVVVANPGFVGVDDCDAVSDVAQGRPVIIDRPLLRVDLAATAAEHGTSPSYVAVDVAAAAGHVRALHVAAGWMRVLAGGVCDVQRVDRSAAAVLLLGQREGSAIPTVLTATTLAGADEGLWLRGVATAASRVEVEVDAAHGSAAVTVASQRGELRVPRRFESSERLSLRRAIDALASGSPVSDVTELRQDAAVAAAVRSGPC